MKTYTVSANEMDKHIDSAVTFVGILRKAMLDGTFKKYNKELYLLEGNIKTMKGLLDEDYLTDAEVYSAIQMHAT